MLKIEMLRTFCTVVQTGTLSDAAAKLGRSQSAVSMTLKQMESHLGQKLFQGDRKNEMTDIGRQVFEIANQQVQQFDQAIDAIEQTVKTSTNFIRLMSVPSVAGAILPTIIRETLAKDSGIRLDLRDGDSNQVRDALINGHADVGILSGTNIPQNLNPVHLFSDSYGLIMTPNHPLAKIKYTLLLDDICAHQIVWNGLLDNISDAPMPEIKATSALTIHNTLSLLSYVLRENGLTILPKTACDLFSSGLTFVPLDHIYSPRRVYVCCSSSNAKSVIVRALISRIQHICSVHTAKSE